MQKIIHWFRQDLRIHDNYSLYYANKAKDVLPIYILDDINAGEFKMGGASRVWLHYSLNSLNKSLNGKLNIFSGDPLEILEKIIKKEKIDAIYWNRCYEPWRIARDKKIKNALEKKGIECKSFNSSLLWEPWEILKDDNLPYKVFTPFYKKAITKRNLIKPELASAKKLNIAKKLSDSISIDKLKLIPNKPWAKTITKKWHIGEAAALKRFNDFMDDGINNYKDGRNFPAKDNVSKLSPNLHFGEISPRTIWNMASAKKTGKDLDTFLSELGWREFSYYLLYHFPQLPKKNLQEKFNKFPWDNNKSLLTKWQHGNTGIPIVDAGMRELWQTGYMHNRPRMIVGSFLVKNLLIHWRYGEKWFWDCLFDADLANNSASWQWVAGCGADAAPYFRIFNPITQGEKFDSDGSYTRKYVPELKLLPDKYLFCPWDAPEEILTKAKIKLGKDYPLPIVDIKESREKALVAYQQIK